MHKNVLGDQETAQDSYLPIYCSRSVTTFPETRGPISHSSTYPSKLDLEGLGSILVV